MKNLFIQSFMDDDSNTFLEVGSKITERFISLPTTFDVTLNGTCWISITKDNFDTIQWDFNVSEEDVQQALEKQFVGKNVQFNTI